MCLLSTEGSLFYRVRLRKDGFGLIYWERHVRGVHQRSQYTLALLVSSPRTKLVFGTSGTRPTEWHECDINFMVHYSLSLFLWFSFFIVDANSPHDIIARGSALALGLEHSKTANITGETLSTCTLEITYQLTVNWSLSLIVLQPFTQEAPANLGSVPDM